jgi:hypothetical protein
MNRMAEKQQSTARWRSKWFLAFKWAGLAGGGFVLLCVLAIAWVVLPDLTRRVPMPEAVTRVAREAERSRHGASFTDVMRNDQNTTRPALVPGMLIYPVNPEEKLMPDLPGFPKELLLNRQAINDDYTSITRQILALKRDAPGLSYEETKQRIDVIHRGTFKVNSIIYKQYVKELEKPEHRATDPLFIAYHGMIHKVANLIMIVPELTFENNARHEHWDECAVMCELEQKENWHDAIYYWRRQGGLEGYWHIVGGSVALRIKDRPLLRPFLRMLPYQSFPDLGSDWRYVWLRPITQLLRR